MNRRAFLLIIIAVALLAIATTVKSGWLYLVSGFLLAIVPVSLFSGWRASRRLDIGRGCPAEVFEGEPFKVSLKVRNTGRLGRSMVSFTDRQFAKEAASSLAGRLSSRRDSLVAMIRADGPGGGGLVRRETAGNAPRAEANVVFDSIPGGGLMGASYDIIAPRRGVFTETEIVISSGGVFGAASIKRSIRTPSPITVFPAISPIDYFAFDPVVSVAPAESHEWGRKGIGQEYYGVREYVVGDSLRHIHWKSSAHHGQLIVKEYQQEFRPTAGLLLLLGRPVYGDTVTNSLEDGLRAAASILDFYTGMGSVPRLVVPLNGGFEFVESETLRGCLQVLAAYEPPGESDGEPAGREPAMISRGVEFAREAIGQGRSLTVVTNAGVEELAGSVGGLNGAEEVSLVLVVEESYGPGWDEGTTESMMDAIRSRASGRPGRFCLLTRGAEIGRCLSEPLSGTAA